MSVQAGIWNFDGQPVEPKLLADFNETLKQEGPDGEFLVVNGTVAMLYRPFHTTAESRREKQPHVSRRGFILTWDGRLDNREQLIVDTGCNLNVFSTDIDIVAAAFDRWETDSFRRIIGDWAVSIWKPDQRELLLAVDYMAIRHIFYYLKQSRIYWATKLEPLVLLSCDTFHIDEDYVSGYLANAPDANLTPYREVHQTPPGQFVRVRNGKVFVERYWRFNPKSWIQYKTDAEYEEHFRYIFRQSVRRRLRSDSPILAELSGGLDSSSIVCMADAILTKEGAETPRLDTLSFCDKTEPDGDDWTYYHKVEQRRGRIGAHIDFSKLGTSRCSLQYPQFSAIPGHLGSGQEIEAERAALVRKGGYRVCLSGTGGDEMMGGIPNPAAQLADLIVQFKVFRLAGELIAWSLVKRKPWPHLLLQATLELLPATLGQYVAKQAKVENWIEEAFAKRTHLAVRLLDVDEHYGLRLPSRRSRIAGVLLMANKSAKFRGSQLAVEEVRRPYLDQDLVEFAMSIPANQLLRPGDRRSLMRRSLVDIVPTEILSRRTKQFMARTPIIMLQSHLDEVQVLFESPLSSTLGYINRARFLNALKAARSGKVINIVRLLRAISLECWLRDLLSHNLLDIPFNIITGSSLHASVIRA